MSRKLFGTFDTSGNRVNAEQWIAERVDRQAGQVMCGGCKATGVKLAWNGAAVLLPVEPRQPCPTCNGSGYAPKEPTT